MKLNYQTIRTAIEAKGYAFFTGELNLNFVGIRMMGGKLNHWDDMFALCYQDGTVEKTWLIQSFTTDPGTYYLQQKLLSPKGCAILAPGQYRRMWTFGKHRGKYDAFIQNAPCKVFRDRDMDNELDYIPDSVQIGNFGINLHHGHDAVNVGPHSAGCQVFRYAQHLKYTLDLARRSAMMYGNNFTYTLLTSEDFK